MRIVTISATSHSAGTVKVPGDHRKLDKEMDNYINAERQPCKCCRKGCNNHFGNNDLHMYDLISFHHVIFSFITAPPIPHCLCCTPHPVIDCCDIWHLTYFKFTAAEPSDKAPEPPQKLMPKAYKCGPVEESLWKDLVSLWWDLAKDKVLMLMAKALMPDSLLDHIKMVAILYEQITWGYLDKCTDTIFDLINKHCPVPKTPLLFTTTPLQHALIFQALTSNNAPSAAASTCSSKHCACQICGTLGHSSTYLAHFAFVWSSLIDIEKICPQWVIAAAVDKENVMP